MAKRSFKMAKRKKQMAILSFKIPAENGKRPFSRGEKAICSNHRSEKCAG